MRVRTNCKEHKTEVEVSHYEVVIDDGAERYRLVCPISGHTISKSMNEKVRTLLRKAGVRTIEEIVASASVTLVDDEEIWRAVEVE